MNQNLARHKISNLTSSRNSKLGDIWFSVVQFHLVHSCVQVPTWWWSKSPFGLICTKGLCIRFIDSGALMRKYQWTYLFYWQHLSLLPTILINLRVELSYHRRPVLGIIDYWHCHQLFLRWGLNFVIKLSYMIFVSSEKFNIHTTSHWSPRSIRPLVFSNKFIQFSLWLGKCFQCYQENIWNNKF